MTVYDYSPISQFNGGYANPQMKLNMGGKVELTETYWFKYLAII